LLLAVHGDEFSGIRSGFSELEAEEPDAVHEPFDPRHPQRILGA